MNDRNFNGLLDELVNYSIVEVRDGGYIIADPILRLALSSHQIRYKRAVKRVCFQLYVALASVPSRVDVDYRFSCKLGCEYFGYFKVTVNLISS